MRWIVLLFLAAPPALAETCPQGVDQSARMQALIAEVQAAPNENAARTAIGRMWMIWRQAPDARAQELLDAGMERLAIYDFDAAEAALSALVAYCPDYAEGYNQRAFAHFLRGDYEAALADLDLALARSPTHVAALAGRALTLIGMGREEEGQEALRAALALNPWLPERHLLKAPKGEDI